MRRVWLGDEVVHDAVGDVHGGEALDGAADPDGAALFGAGGELCGVPDIGVEEFDLVAAEFLDAGAADGGLALGEQLDAGPVVEADASLGDFALDHVVEPVAFEEVAEVGVHAFGLLERSGEDADLDAGLEDEVEGGGDGAEVGFAAAAVGPDDAVSGRAVFEEGVCEVGEGGVVVVEEGVAGCAEAEVVLEPGGEFGVGGGGGAGEVGHGGSGGRGAGI